MGPSGCGKSTLLNMLGLVDKPSSGAFWFFGQDVARYSEEQLTAVAAHRRNRLHLPELQPHRRSERGRERRGGADLPQSAIGAAQAAHRRGGWSGWASRTRAKHMPQQLFRRTAAARGGRARALVCEPKLILADEPTGNLDTANGEAVMELLEGVVGGGTNRGDGDALRDFCRPRANAPSTCSTGGWWKRNWRRLRCSRNYLAAALRNMVRNKLQTFLNVTSLALGLAAALLAFLYVRQETSL